MSEDRASTEKPPAPPAVYLVAANSGYMETRQQWVGGIYLTEDEALQVARDEEQSGTDMTRQEFARWDDAQAADARAQYEAPAATLEREMRGYYDALGRKGALAAEAAGVTQEALMSGLVGVARIRVTGDLWEPDEQGKLAFVTPVRVERGNASFNAESPDPDRAVRTGDIVDIVAWHPARPDRWATRTGEAVALGAVPYRLADDRVEDLHVRSSPLEWLRHGGDGIMLLTPDPTERRLILGSADRVVVEDPNLREELRRALARSQHITVAATPAPRQENVVEMRPRMALRA